MSLIHDDGDIDSSEMCLACAFLVRAGCQRQSDRTIIKSVDMVYNLLGHCSIVGLDGVPAVVASGALVDEVAPGGVYHQVAIFIRVVAHERRGADWLVHRLFGLKRAGRKVYNTAYCHRWS